MRYINLSRQEKIIISALIILSVLSWIATVFHSHSMNSQISMEMEMPMDMGHHPAIIDASLFLIMWVVMMIAMMFPAVVPMVLIFSKVHENRKAKDEGTIPTWVFVSGYLLVWAFFGMLAYFVDLSINRLATNFQMLKSYGSVIGGIVLLAAGLYQLTPLKNACLTHCRSPLHFIIHRWRKGYTGALTMGVDHGVYCLGCCWGLMFVLFVVGLMNLSWMGILTLVIFVEKISKHGVIISKLVGGFLIILGVIMAIQPGVISFIF
jgi:predicted metal-binding membrane protein